MIFMGMTALTMMTKKITITIIDTPSEAGIIARELRRFLLGETTAFVWDNCDKGSPEQPRRLEAAFLGVRGDRSEQKASHKAASQSSPERIKAIGL